MGVRMAQVAITTAAMQAFILVTGGHERLLLPMGFGSLLIDSFFKAASWARTRHGFTCSL